MVAERRRKNAITLVVVASVLGLAAAAVGWVGDKERVASYWVDAELDASLSAEVTEVIEYDFGSQKRHGIFREIPDLDLSVPPRVVSETAPHGVEMIGELEPEIRIGDPETLIKGRHTYQIEYSLVSLADEDGEIAWDAVGTDWLVGMDRVEVHLRAPFELAGVRCNVGRLRSTETCEVSTVAPGHLLVEIEGLKGPTSSRGGEGVTIYADRGKPVAIASVPDHPGLTANDPRVSTLWLAAIGLVASGVVMPVVSRLLRYLGRERVRDGMGNQVRVDAADLAEHAGLRSTASPDLAAWQGGVIMDERVLPRHQAAWIAQRAIEGQIVLEGDKELVLKVGPAGLRDRLLAPMFAGRDTIRLGQRDPAFRSAWKEVGVVIGRFAKDENLWDKRADRVRNLVILVGVLVALTGLVMAFFGAVGAGRRGSSALPLLVAGLVLAGVGLAAMVRAWELRVRTPEGSETWLSIETFRRYLAQAEAEQADWAAENGVVTQYAAWAVALGEIDRWTKAVKSSSAYTSRRQDHLWTSMYMVSRLSRLERVSVQAAASSSSSSGGGGSVGGGGGGGGGGSW